MAAELGIKQKQKQKRKANTAGGDAPAATAIAAPEQRVMKTRAKRSATAQAHPAGELELDQPHQAAGPAVDTRTSDGTAMVEPALHTKKRRCPPWRTASLRKDAFNRIQMSVVPPHSSDPTADCMAMQEEEAGRCGGCGCQPRGACTPSLPAGAAGELATIFLLCITGDTMEDSLIA